MEDFELKRNRDAWATIRGYVYQVDQTIKHWISLKDNEILELERGEDIDVVTVLTATEEQRNRVLGQVKHREKNITLRTSEALEAIINYFEHIQLNPDSKLIFRFITNAQIAKERPQLFKKQAALHVWESLRTGKLLDDKSLVNLKLIRDFLRTLSKPDAIEKPTWLQWNKYLSQVTEEDFFLLVKGFTWSAASSAFDELQSEIENTLVTENIASSIDEAKEIYERLFLYVFKMLSKSGIKSLTKKELELQVENSISSQEDVLLLSQIRFIWSQFEERVKRIEQLTGEQQNQMIALQEHVEKIREDVGFKATINLAVQRPVLDVPDLSRIIEREDIVKWFIKEIKSTSWCMITGNYGSGKTSLTALIAKQYGAVSGWIRLHDLNPTQAYSKIDDVLFELTRIKPTSNWNQWYQKVCENLVEHEYELLIIDDLPRTNGTHLLDEKLRMLAESCSLTGFKILSTSAYKLNKSYQPLISEDKVRQYEVPKFDEKDIREIFLLQNAPEEFYRNEKYIALVAVLTKGHPLLANAASRYFSGRNWKMDEQAFEALFSGKYADDFIEDIQSAIISYLEDVETRDFLYRLTVVGAPFDNEQIQKISAISPAISRPFEKVVNITGLWIQKDTESKYLVSPILKPLGQLNLDKEIKREVNRVLGLHIVHKRKIYPGESLQAINYFIAADAYKEAGITLILSLDQLEQQEIYVDNWGFTSIWTSNSLPEQMDSLTKLVLRIKQIMILQKMGESTSYLIEDLDLLLSNTKNVDSNLIASITLYAASIHALNNVEKASAYLESSLPILNAEGKINEESTDLPVNLASVVWLIGAGIKTNTDLKTWLKSLKSLGSEQLNYAKQSELYTDSCLNICNQIWVRESEKERNLQDWNDILTLFEEVSKCAEELNLNLLLACSIRGRLIVMTDYLKNTSDALELANHTLNHNSLDSVEQYLIRDAIGRHYVYKEDYMEAINWLSKALKTELNIYPIEHIYTYIELSKAIGEYDVQQATFYTNQALKMSREIEDVSEILLLKIIGENIIAHWKANDFYSVLGIYEEAVRYLLEADKENDDWKAIFVTFGHALGYIISEIMTGSPPTSASDGGDYIAPFRGFFTIERPLTANAYLPENEFFMATHLGMIEKYFNKREEAVHWTLTAFDLAKSKGNRNSIGLIGVQVLPLLLEEYEYALSLDTALNIQVLFEMYQQGNTHNSNVTPEEVLGEKPNKKWNEAEEKAIIISIIPAILKLMNLYNEDSDHASKLADQVKLLSNQMKITASDFELWDELSNAIEAIFSKDKTYQGLVALGNRVTKWESLKMIYYLAASYLSTPENAIRIFNTVASFLENTYKAWKDLNTSIIIPFFTDYWSSIILRNSNSFENPEKLKLELKAFEKAEEGSILLLLKKIEDNLMQK